MTLPKLMIPCALALFVLNQGDLIAESLPPLSPDTVPQTPEALWAGYDPDAEPLDVRVVREWTEDGCVVRFITYTIGTFKGKTSTMAAFYAAPENPQGKIPALIQMHGGGQRASIASAKIGAENGYACLSINWGGREMERAEPGDPTTDWGALDATQAGHNSHYSKLTPDHLTLDPFESPRNNNWFLITLSARRGISFLQQQPEVDRSRIGAFGHSMGGFLTVMLAGADPRIKAGTPSCGGSGSAPDVIRNRPNAGVRRKHSPLYHQTCDDGAYIPLIKVPMLYMGPQNDFNGILDNMFENWKSMPSEQIAYTVNPHMNHRATAEHVFPSMLWFDAHLKGSFDFPQTPDLTVDLQAPNGIPVATLTPDQLETLAKVDIYYSVDNHILSRFWRTAPARRVGNRWRAELPVTSTKQSLFVLANVYYTLAHPVIGYPWMREAPETFGITSQMQSVAPAELQDGGVRGDRIRDRMIQANFDYQDWYQLNWENPHHWSTYTRKLKDPRFTGPDGAALALDLHVDQDTTFVLHIRNNSWGAYPGEAQGDYYASVTVNASPDWQTVSVLPADFQPANSRTTEPLAHWRHITEFGLCGRLKIQRDGKQVVLPEDSARATWHTPRAVKNLRWEGGTAHSPAGQPWTTRNESGAFENAEFQQAIDASIELEKLDEASTDTAVYLRVPMASKVDSFWQVIHDRSVSGKQKIRVGGTQYDRGLGVHAPSTIVFPLDAAYKTFHVVPGPDDAHRGIIEMKIRVDGKEVFASGSVSSQGYSQKPLSLPVAGAKTLTLIVTEADGDRGGDHASWADARLTK